MPKKLPDETRAAAERMLARGAPSSAVAKKLGISSSMARKIRVEMAAGKRTTKAPKVAAAPPPPMNVPDAPPMVPGPAATGCDMCATGCQRKCPGAWWEDWLARLVAMRANPFATDTAAVVFAGAGVAVRDLGEWLEQGATDIAQQRFDTPAAELLVKWRAAQARALEGATQAASEEMRSKARGGHAAKALAIQLPGEYGPKAAPERVGATGSAEGIRKMLGALNASLEADAERREKSA